MYSGAVALSKLLKYILSLLQILLQALTQSQVRKIHSPRTVHSTVPLGICHLHRLVSCLLCKLLIFLPKSLPRLCEKANQSFL